MLGHIRLKSESKLIVQSDLHICCVGKFFKAVVNFLFKYTLNLI